MQRRALPIRLHAARIAEQSARQQVDSPVAAAVAVAVSADPERCTQQCAQSAAKRRRYLSYLVATSPYTALTASRTRDRQEATAAGNQVI